jgi:hypothetical protein
MAMADDGCERFFLPDYLAARGWVGVALDRGAVDRDLVTELLTGGYRSSRPSTCPRARRSRA